MFLVGLTGGIATGKTTVSSYILDKGYPVINADEISREVVQPGKPAWKKIKSHFGEKVIKEDGQLDRALLGTIIFSDENQRKILNKITHPEIYKCMLWRVLRYALTGHQFVVLDLPLLYESGAMLPYISYIIVASCDAEKQLSRLRARNQLSQQVAEQRIAAQMDLAEKKRRAHIIIDNNGSIEETFAQTDQVLASLRASRKHWLLRSVIIGSLGVIFCVGYKFAPLACSKLSETFNWF